jgi:hypothetical protein
MRKRWFIVLTVAIACTAVVTAETKKDNRKTRRNAAAPTLQSVMGFNETRHKEQVASIIEESERYTGIHVCVDKNSKSVSAPQLKRIATIMTEADIVPPDRLQRFSWLSEQYPTKITGWSATIVEAAPTDGGMLVKFRVTPMQTGLMTTDYALETYRISDSGAQLLQIGFPPHRGMISFN